MRMIREARRVAGVEKEEADTVAILLETYADRAEKDTGRRFVSMNARDIENMWNAFTDRLTGQASPMSADAAKAALDEIKAVLRFEPVIRYDKIKNPRGQVETVRRVDITHCELPSCECSGGVQHYELPVDDILDGMEDALRDLAAATDAEDAHVARWVYSALVSVLANHGISVNTRKLWDRVKPPTVTHVTRAEFQRYKAWDGRWKLTAEHSDGTVEATFDHFHLFTRAATLAVEEAAREAPRPIVPPIDWTPTKEGAEAPSGESDDVTAAP